MRFISFFISLLSAFSIFANDISYDSLCNAVKRAQTEKLTKTVISLLDSIVEKSAYEKAHNEWLKSVCKRAKAVSQLNDENKTTEIKLLEKELQNAVPKARPLVQIVLARWYWRYYDERKWHYLSRQENEIIDTSVISTWSLEMIFSKIESLYLESLKSKNDLLKIPISEFSDFLEPGTLPVKLRPTL